MEPDRSTPEDPTVKAGPCEFCHVGKYRLTYGPYFVWARSEMIAVQNFPIWECDICSWREYDRGTLLWLKSVLAPTEEMVRSGIVYGLGSVYVSNPGPLPSQ